MHAMHVLYFMQFIFTTFSALCWAFHPKKGFVLPISEFLELGILITLSWF